jgi:hypothetical protein
MFYLVLSIFIFQNVPYFLNSPLTIILTINAFSYKNTITCIDYLIISYYYYQLKYMSFLFFIQIKIL